MSKNIPFNLNTYFSLEQQFSLDNEELSAYLEELYYPPSLKALKNKGTNVLRND